jgi:copper chaperone CopZ
MDRIIMTIDGMSCSHCVGMVKKALEEVDGVQVEQVQVGAATVSYDPTATSDGEIARAIEGQGYTVRSTARQN